MAPDNPRPPDTNWTLEWNLYRRACELDPAQREAYLAEQCAGDPELRRNVEDLLAAAQKSSPLFDTPWLHALALADEESSENLNGAAAERHGAPIPPGTVLANRFEIIGSLARGGMGMVYEARDRTLDVHIAIKVIDPALGIDGAVRERFRREVNLARRVTHPNVCRVFDLVEESGFLFLSMELLRGESLAERLTRGAMSEQETRSITNQVASALEAAHRVGVIHRDFKPGNVMLVPEGHASVRAVVTDFGLAVPITPTGGEPHPITRTGQLLGTLAYMAPEQLEGRPVTNRTDLYALGLLIHQMLTGKLPFRAETPVSMALERLRKTPPIVVPLEVDRRWKRIIQRCLERNPNDRYSSASEFLAALRGDTAVGLPPTTRRKLLLATAAVVAIVVATAGIISLVKTRNKETPPARSPTPIAAVARRVWEGPDVDVLGAPSPDGRYLSYVDWETGDLAVRELATGKKRRLTSELQDLGSASQPHRGRDSRASNLSFRG